MKQRKLTPRQIIERDLREAQRLRDLRRAVCRNAVKVHFLPHAIVYDLRCPNGPHLASFLDKGTFWGHEFLCRHCLVAHGEFEHHLLTSQTT